MFFKILNRFRENRASNRPGDVFLITVLYVMHLVAGQNNQSQNNQGQNSQCQNIQYAKIANAKIAKTKIANAI